MALKATVTRRAGWKKVTAWVLEGSYLELHMDFFGHWLVVDGRKPDHRIGGPYEKVNRAKVAVEQLLTKEPGKYRR